MKIIMKVLLMLILGTAQFASANDNLCSDDIKNAISDINLNADGFLSKNANRDIDGLIGKLSAADGKLDFGKIEDARQKVGDAMSKLDQLIGGGKPKITIDTYDFVSGSVTVVMVCINNNYL